MENFEEDPIKEVEHDSEVAVEEEKQEEEWDEEEVKPTAQDRLDDAVEELNY